VNKMFFSFRSFFVSIFLLFSVGLAAASPTRYNGWWWNPAEAGSGVSIECQGDRRNPVPANAPVQKSQCFIALYMYRADGSPVWYVVQEPIQEGNILTGNILELEGGQTMLGSFKQPKVLPPAGQIRVEFGADSSMPAVVVITTPTGSRSLTIQRFESVSGGLTRPSTWNPDPGWWWNRNEPGRGYYIESQKDADGRDRVFVAIYGYAESGKSEWQVIPTTTRLLSSVDGSAFFGAFWNTFRGGSTLQSAVATNVTGEASSNLVEIQFNNACKATLRFDPRGVNRTITIERFDLTGKGYNCTANLPRPNQLRPIGAKLPQSELTQILPLDNLLIGDLGWQRSIADGRIKYLDTGMVLTGFNNEPIIYAVYAARYVGTNVTCRAPIYKNSGLTFELRPEQFACFNAPDIEWWMGSSKGIVGKQAGRCFETEWTESTLMFTTRQITCPN
jgi:hypothetical protein